MQKQPQVKKEPCRVLDGVDVVADVCRKRCLKYNTLQYRSKSLWKMDSMYASLCTTNHLEKLCYI